MNTAGLKFIFILFLMGCPALMAGPLYFCGSLDLRELKNVEVINLLFLNDLAKNRHLERIQCGLPGEVLPLCSSCIVEPSEITMSFLRPLLGSPDHSKWHTRWHQIRTQEELDAQTFASLQKDHSIPSKTSLEDFKKHLFQGASFGEDFFYMHRLMIKMVQLELAAAGMGCIAPWSEIPEIKDPQWPHPKTLSGTFTEEKSQQDLVLFRRQLSNFRKPSLLGKLSLNELGLRVEPLVHQNLHAFYRSEPVCSNEAVSQGFCDDLLPLETSPLNKHFWKLHGLIDGLLGDWLKAHIYTEIARECEGRPHCYQWQDPWAGPYPKGF